MPNKCEKCGKDFYSDTEFEEHQFLEEIRELASSVRIASNKVSADMYNILLREMQVGNILKIAAARGITFPEAMEEYIQNIEYYAVRSTQRKQEQEAENGGQGGVRS